MNEIKNRQVRTLLSNDNLDQYPAKTINTRDVNDIYYLDVGYSGGMTFVYYDSETRDSDKELLELYLD